MIEKQKNKEGYPLLSQGELSVYVKNLEICLIQQGRDLTRLEKHVKDLESTLETLKELRG